jgi:hypothetical protein
MQEWLSRLSPSPAEAFRAAAQMSKKSSATRRAPAAAIIVIDVRFLGEIG